MSVYVVTGKLGAGKTLCAVGRIRDYLLAGRRVATNLNLDLVALLGPFNSSAVCYRVPDRPRAEDLDAIGNGSDSVDESTFGLLVFDECATWLNSRNWNEDGRAALIDWLLHARKRGWDVIFIVQDKSLLDKQAREAFAEHVVYCRRMDRMPIPFIGSIAGIFLPRVHLAIVRYGDSDSSMVVDRWVYRGVSLFRAYDTRQIFNSRSSSCLFQYLSPFLLRGRYMRLTKVRYQVTRVRRFFVRHWLLVALAGAVASAPLYAFWFRPSSSPGSKTASVPATTSLRSFLDTLFIVGSIRTGSSIEYFFRSDVGDLSVEDLHARGVSVAPVSECLAFARSGDVVSALSCSPRVVVSAPVAAPVPAASKSSPPPSGGGLLKRLF